MCTCMCVCVSVYIYLYLHGCVCVWMCVCVFVCICVYTWLYQCACLALWLCHSKAHSKVFDDLVATCSLSYIMIDGGQIEQVYTENWKITVFGGKMQQCVVACIYVCEAKNMISKSTKTRPHKHVVVMISCFNMHFNICEHWKLKNHGFRWWVAAVCGHLYMYM